MLMLGIRRRPGVERFAVRGAARLGSHVLGEASSSPMRSSPVMLRSMNPQACSGVRRDGRDLDRPAAGGGVGLHVDRPGLVRCFGSRQGRRVDEPRRLRRRRCGMRSSSLRHSGWITPQPSARASWSAWRNPCRGGSSARPAARCVTGRPDRPVSSARAARGWAVRFCPVSRRRTARLTHHSDEMSEGRPPATSRG